jgi:hypothetical protein
VTTLRRVNEDFGCACEDVVDGDVFIGVDVFDRELYLLRTQDLDLVEVDKIWLNFDSLTEEGSGSGTFASR